MSNGKFDVKYESETYDINQFLKNHPGGLNYVRPYKDKDVTKKLTDHEHSKAAFYLLKEYKDNGNNPQQPEHDLEKLVDWNKPMLAQVGTLGENYYEWVTSPVDRELRLFENPFMENLTKTPWYVVPTVWIPVIIYFAITGTQKYIQLTKDSTPFWPVLFSLAQGVLLWTLLEYSLHRWVFHVEPYVKSKFMINFHFAIHGLHHKVPFDPKRLVFPPVPAALITYLLYKPLKQLLPESISLLVLSGAIAGYVSYDMIHFYLHYGSPSESTYFYHLKRYHNQHHFAHQDSGFGISSVIWDKVFGTTLKLRKLKIGIKW